MVMGFKGSGLGFGTLRLVTSPRPEPTPRASFGGVRGVLYGLYKVGVSVGLRGPVTLASLGSLRSFRSLAV